MPCRLATYSARKLYSTIAESITIKMLEIRWYNKKGESQKEIRTNVVNLGEDSDQRKPSVYLGRAQRDGW